MRDASAARVRLAWIAGMAIALSACTGPGLEPPGGDSASDKGGGGPAHEGKADAGGGYDPNVNGGSGGMQSNPNAGGAGSGGSNGSGGDGSGGDTSGAGGQNSPPTSDAGTAVSDAGVDEDAGQDQDP